MNIFSFTNKPEDWPEDSNLENGNYFNKCSVCNKEFVGHKRRVICKSCAITPPPIK